MKRSMSRVISIGSKEEVPRCIEIVRGDKNKFYQINNAERTYIEAALMPEMRPNVEEKLNGETARKPMGTERSTDILRKNTR